MVLQMDPSELEMHLRALEPVGGMSAVSSAAAAAAASTSASATAASAHSTAHNTAQLGAHPARDHDHEYLEMVDRLDISLNLDDDQVGAELGTGDADEGSLDRSRSHNQVRAPSDGH